MIPVLNRARVIETAVSSAIQQPEVTQVAIINDRSTEATQNMLEQLEQDYCKIEVVHLEIKHKKGCSTSRNLAIKE